MGRYRVYIGGLLACALVGLNLVMASPAQANVTTSVDCSGTTNRDTIVPLELRVGEKLTISTSEPGDCTRLQVRRKDGADPTGEVEYTNSAGNQVAYNMDPFGSIVPLGQPFTVIYTATVVGGAELLIQTTGFPNPLIRNFWEITVIEAPEPTPNSNPLGADEGPAPLVQQFGKPDVGSCEDVAPQEMNWAGVAGGGWSESWAQWMHDGNGGAVCTRTLEYHQGHSRWMIN